MPLPKPRAGEERANFVDRCIVDLNVVNDFRSMDQRIAVCNSLYEQEQEIKSVSENWGSLFEAELKRAERESIKDFRDYYSSQYNKASAHFILTGNLNQADLSAYFQNNDLQNMYRDMYEKIGLRFANWYAKHWKKALAKATDINGYQSIWQAKFAYIGEQVGAKRVTLVSGTAKETLIKITQQAMRDPQFMALGDREKARILRSQFDKYSDYQARRLVRTESTNAANFATMQSASDLFPAHEMNKVWITAIDGRERPAHHSANRQTVQFTKPFIVGGESLMHPGDSNGSAGNVINCRCSVAPIPRPNAQTIGEAITDIGFGMAQAQVESVISNAFITPEIAAVIATEIAVASVSEAKTIKEAEHWALDNGISQFIDYSGMTVENANTVNNALKTVFNDFGIDPLKTLGGGNFRKTSSTLAEANGSLLNINKIKYTKENVSDLFKRNVTNWRSDLEERLIRYDTFLGDTNYDQKKVAKGIKEIKKSLLYDRHNVFISELDVLENTIIHESGHIIEDQLLGRIRGVGAIQERFKITTSEGYKKIGPQVFELRNEFDDIYKNLSKAEKYSISAYGATESSETFAESLVMYYKEPDKMPVSLKNFFDKLKEYAKR
jgi:hypothetical protein